MGFRRRIPPIALYRNKAEKLQESFYRAIQKSHNYAYFFSVEHVVKYSAVNVQNREFAYLSLVT